MSGDQRHCVTPANAPASGAGRTLPDGTALDQIAEMLRDPRWGVGMLEDIGEVVTRTGRSIDDYPDGRPTWGRH